MTDKFDAIVVGAGHNGLVCSALLAKAGKRVLVLEANQQVGGAAIPELGDVVAAVKHRGGVDGTHRLTDADGYRGTVDTELMRVAEADTNDPLPVSAPPSGESA